MSKTRSHRGRGRKPARPAHPQAAAPVTVQIATSPDALGAQGDAMANSPDGRLYIPYALPGETVSVRPGAMRGDGRMAEVLEVTSPSADRVAPPCPHFGTCGGCAMQHMAPASLANWKRDLVTRALAKRGFTDIQVDETVSLPPATRRRAVFGWRRTSAGVLLGFNARQSDHLIDLSQCMLMVPAIADALPLLRSGLKELLPLGATGDLLMIATDEGLDIRLDLPDTPDLAAREGLAELAETLDLARLMLRIGRNVEPVAVRRQPTVRFGEHSILLPSGAFLQPSREGEHAILRLVEDGLQNLPSPDGPVADLFCGLGTFSFPLAATHHQVVAVDGDEALTGALGSAAAAPRLRGRLKAVRRDLFRNPFSGADLAGLSAVLLDPPRAGAREQTQALAAPDGPSRIVYVSCNPATFARDARILVEGGYRLERVTPVDQFSWSAHLELVAVFQRD